MRRLVLLSSLAGVGLGLASGSAAAQSGYGSYRGDTIMAPEPRGSVSAPQPISPRPSYNSSVESQPLPPAAGGGAPYPYETQQRPQSAQPVESIPSYDGRNPSYGAMPPYNEPYSQTPRGQYPAGPNTAYPGNTYPPQQSGPYAPSQGGNYATDPTPPRPPATIDASRGTYPPYPGSAAPYQEQQPQGAPGATAARPGTVPGLPPEDQPEVGEPKELPPQFKRQIVSYQTKEPAGTIIIDTPSTFLYYVNGDGTAIRYGIGVGREGFTWSGTERITRMAEWPDWHPPAEMIERQPYLPRFMAGGLSNPMGARALYLGKTIYRVHGTNQPSTIGQFVSSGCIRMLNSDVEDLYTRVKVGTKVVVLGDGKGASASR